MNALYIITRFKVGLATYKLTGEANYQWEECKEMFYERFFNQIPKANKVIEFMNMKQDEIPVLQYENHFNQLLRLA